MSCVITWAQKNHPPTSKKNKKGCFFKKIYFSNWDFVLEISHLRKKFSCQTQKCKLEHCMSKGSKVLIYLSLYLSASISWVVDSNPQGLISSTYKFQLKTTFISKNQLRSAWGQSRQEKRQQQYCCQLHVVHFNTNQIQLKILW